MSTIRFRVSGPHVIHQVIEGEAILVNLDNGRYYSTQNTGREIWDGIEQGAAVSAVVEHLMEEYSAEPGIIRASVLKLLDELQQEGLVVLDDSPEPNTNHTTSSDTSSQIMAETRGGSDDVSPAPSSEKPAFVAPVLYKYTEMQDLLLLDPIHDVDDSGWPRPAEPAQ